MERFVYFMRSIEPSEIDKQRQACHRLAGGNAEVVAEFIDYGSDGQQVFRQALELTCSLNATLVCGTDCTRER